jgi:threonine/homoserine/homoserine lactone efflux protein
MSFRLLRRLGALVLAYAGYLAWRRRQRNIVTPAASAETAATMEHVGAATAPSEEVAAT